MRRRVVRLVGLIRFLFSKQEAPPVTYETDQPWVIYHFTRTDRRVFLLGRGRCEMFCANCGVTTVMHFRVNRTGTPRIHPETELNRALFLDRHEHPGHETPMHWAVPLANVIGAREYLAARASLN